MESVASLCHPWFTTTNLSYRIPIFETSTTALCGTTGTTCLSVLLSITSQRLSMHEIMYPHSCNAMQDNYLHWRSLSYCVYSKLRNSIKCCCCKVPYIAEICAQSSASLCEILYQPNHIIYKHQMSIIPICTDVFICVYVGYMHWWHTCLCV